MQDSIGFSELKIAEAGFSTDEDDTEKTNKFTVMGLFAGMQIETNKEELSAECHSVDWF